ncbi:MAG: flippase-like domain-containing protein [Rhodospirillaceae bacterium]|nr:flippase-like domain-containing protein [Rhodospirillaceae bacterium]
MWAFKLAAFAGGAALFAWILHDSDLSAVTAILTGLGAAGIAAILANFAVGFVADVISWLLMFRSLPPTGLWLWRIWLVQMVGEALNVLTPFGSFGGEPFKALLLKRHYGVSYTEGSASLLLIQTVNSLAQVPFLLVAVGLLIHRHLLPPTLEQIILAAAIVISGFMILVLVALHSRLLAALHARLERSRWRRFDQALRVLEDIEGRLFFFMRESPRRFAASYLLAFATWMVGAVEMFLLFRFLGHPIDFTDAWLIEGIVSIARSVSFFIPAHLGFQDGAIALLGSALTGAPDMGVAIALARRARELAWSAFGLAIGGWFSLKKPLEA